MQPYIFPYVGYFQLVNAVDKLIFYDDVNFIKGGWINRNRILLNGQPFLFTLPIRNLSSNSTIIDTEINLPLFQAWKDKFYKTIRQAYGKAPYFEEGFGVLQSSFDEKYESIAKMARSSIVEVSKYLALSTDFASSSENYSNKHLSGEERVIEICKNEKATDYINLNGGKHLYCKEHFQKHSIKLHFIQHKSIHYRQFNAHFVENLSIIDMIMFVDKSTIKNLLTEFVLD